MSSEITQSVGIVDSLEQLDTLLARVSEDAEIFGKFSQEKVDKIFSKACFISNQKRVVLAKLAVEEGGMGILEDKTIKNHFASEAVHATYLKMKTCGIIERDEAGGFAKYAEPIGILAAIVPCTNPTSTAIFKALLALKTRNCIVFSPHPRTAKCTIAAAKVVRDAAVAAGAPANCISWIDIPTVELCNELMRHPRVQTILASGTGGVIKAAYSAGKPALGGGSANTPVVIDETVDIPVAVNSVLLSKTFDNGMISSSEQAIIAVEQIAEDVKEEFAKRGAYILSSDEKEKVGKFVVSDKGAVNPEAIGQPAWRIAELAGVTGHPIGCRLLLAELSEVGPAERLSHEKLCPVLGFYVAKSFDHALVRALELVKYGGMGHTSVLYTDLDGREKDKRVEKFQSMMPTGRALINMPTSQGAIGGFFNFRQMPSLCIGSNTTTESLQAKHLLHYKEVSERREHIMSFIVPAQTFFNRGTLREALGSLRSEGLRRAFIVSGQSMKNLGYMTRLTEALQEQGIEFEVFCDVTPDPDERCVNAGVQRMNFFNPDCVIAFGGGSPLDAAKIMRLQYEYPNISLDSLYTRFMDMSSRIVKFPKLGIKVKKLVAIPTTSGTGSEMTPFAVIKDSKAHVKYPIADYSLTPEMAIVDADFVLSMPQSVCAHTGYDAMTHAMEAHVSMLSNDYTQALSIKAIKLLFKYLVKSVNEAEPKAREAVHNASSIAGMAFANAFLGITHSLAHQLGGTFGIPHGCANAMLLCQVIKFNAEDAPSKQGTFPQYAFPKAKEQYAEVADAMHFTEGCVTLEEKVDRLVQALDELKVAIGIPQSIKEYGVGEGAFMDAVDDMALRAFDDQCTPANPRYPLVPELRQIYIDAYYGKIRYLRLEVVHDVLARKHSLLEKIAL